MMAWACEEIRMRIPDRVAGRLHGHEGERVDAHLASCSECRDEAAFVGLMLEGRPAVPEGLADRVRQAVHRRGGRRHPAWGLAAAAVAVLAVGIGVNGARDGHGGIELPLYVSEGIADEALWMSDDGFIAGAPALDGLSDEALVMLLEEMNAGGAG